MSININSEAECRKAYLNYHCYGNSMNISASEMGEITSAWSNRLTSWQATVTSDETEYDFDDTDYSKYKAQGRETAKEKAGDIGSNAWNYTDSIGTAVFSGAGAAGALITQFGGKAVGNILAKTSVKLIKDQATGLLRSEVTKQVSGETAKKILGEKAAEKALEKGGGEATKEVGKNLSAIATAILATTVAAAYWIRKPNKDEVEACNDLQEEMAGAQADLAGRQSEMADYSGEIMDLSDQTMEINEATNEQIAEQKTLYDQYMQTILALQAKVDAGEELTDSEKELYNEVVGVLQETGVTIEDLAATSGEEVTEIYDEMGEYQEGYDEVAESMGQVEGLTDFAASFDQDTRAMATMEAISQGLNAASAGRAAVRLFAGPWWNYAFGIMATAAGASSLLAANEQKEFVGQVGDEIDAREMTQDINSETMDMYDEEIDAFDGFMQGVEDLELEIPEEFGSEDEGVEAPTVDVALPTGGTGGSTEDTEPKPKPKDEEK